MRIVFGHELFPPDVAGGGEKLALRLAKHLKNEGHEVRIVTSGDPALKNYEGVETIRVPANRYLMNVLALPELIKQAAWADIVIASSGNMALPAYVAARHAKKPVALWVHHIFGKYWRDIRGPVLGRLFEFFERVIFNLRFDAVVFQNESSKALGLGMGVRRSSIRMISPGVDFGTFNPAKIRRRRGVLVVGSMNMDRPAIINKGIKYIGDAKRLLPDVHFTIVTGPIHIRYEPLPGWIDVPAGYSWQSKVKPHVLVHMYRTANAFACASLNEGFGLALLEAMACGCPIVSTVDIGQVGPKVKPKDAKALADAIRFYMDNPAKAREDGMKNASLARGRTWEKFYSHVEKLYTDLNKHRSK